MRNARGHQYKVKVSGSEKKVNEKTRGGGPTTPIAPGTCFVYL